MVHMNEYHTISFNKASYLYENQNLCKRKAESKSHLSYILDLIKPRTTNNLTYASKHSHKPQMQIP